MANSDPIYSRVGDIQLGQIGNSGTLLGQTANTAMDGTGTLYPIWQADTTSGGFLQKLTFAAIGTTTSATTVRVFISNITGAWTGNTAANTALYTDFSLPVITVSNTAAAPHFELPMNIAMPPGYRIVIAFGTSTGGSTVGWSVCGVGGKY